MKKIGFALMLFISVFAHAQVSVNINIGTPPSWGPQGYDNNRYYYLPDIDIYYDVVQSQFIYENNGRWIRENRLPSKYRQYDLYNGYKVVLSNHYKGDAPYTYHKEHLTNYPKGYQGQPQQNRGDKPARNANANQDQRTQNGNSQNRNSQNRNSQDQRSQNGNAQNQKPQNNNSKNANQQSGKDQNHQGDNRR